MITVKQILEQYNLATDNATANENKLAELSDAGLFESSKLPMIKRSLNKNVNEMTEAEKKTLKYLLESLMTHILVEKNQKVDKAAYPSDKDMPTVIILKRKAIRVFPDHQKVGLYYSQALDRYVSIPFSKDLSPQINEAKKEYQPPEELQTLIQKDPELVGAASNELAKQKYNAFRKKVISNTPIEDLAKNPKHKIYINNGLVIGEKDNLAVLENVINTINITEIPIAISTFKMWVNKNIISQNLTQMNLINFLNFHFLFQ